MKFTIDKIILHCNWKWDIFNNDCAICRNSICESINSNSKSDEDGSVVGECGHAFHYTCILSWLNNKNICPLCTKPWKYKVNESKS